jgi:hypothetical protein
MNLQPTTGVHTCKPVLCVCFRRYAVLLCTALVLAGCAGARGLVGRYEPIQATADGNLVFDFDCENGLSDAELLAELYGRNKEGKMEHRQLYHGVLPVVWGAYANPTRTVRVTLAPGTWRLVLHEIRSRVVAVYDLDIPKTGKWYVSVSFWRFSWNSPYPHFLCLQAAGRYKRL